LSTPLTGLTQTFMSVNDVNPDVPGKITSALPDHASVYPGSDAAAWSITKENRQYPPDRFSIPRMFQALVKLRISINWLNILFINKLTRTAL
jgi:hypothetical protein